MIRRPPRSTLFPYRRSSDLFRHPELHDPLGRDLEGLAGLRIAAHPRLPVHQDRSEEHTSELQSQSNLVCRLLLEKKKTKTKSISPAIRSYYPEQCVMPASTE